MRIEGKDLTIEEKRTNNRMKNHRSHSNRKKRCYHRDQPRPLNGNAITIEELSRIAQIDQERAKKIVHRMIKYSSLEIEGESLSYEKDKGITLLGKSPMTGLIQEHTLVSIQIQPHHPLLTFLTKREIQTMARDFSASDYPALLTIIRERNHPFNSEQNRQ
jgi:hypothetical protein